MVKISALVALAIWVSDLPGSVKISWADYDFSIAVGYFLMIAALVVLVGIFLYNTIMTFVRFPSSYKRYREIRDKEKGYRALTLGLTAVAAGDVKVATKQADLATKLLKDDTGLPLLLKAQTCRMNGDEPQALQTFAALLENEDAAFLGVRGLLQAALDRKDHAKALTLAQQALKIHPKQPWILKLVYELQIKQYQWNDAYRSFNKIKKHTDMTAAQVQREHTAILLATAEDLRTQRKDDEALKVLKRAHDADPKFAPAATRLAQLYIEKRKRAKALSTLEKSWKKSPHPEIANLWRGLIAKKKAGNSIERIKWFEKLHKLNTKSSRSLLEAGQTAMDEGLWGKARTYLEEAQDIAPTKELYKKLANLERLSGNGEEIAQRWLKMAETAPDARLWMCKETGRIYESWSPVALPHGSFNTIEWTTPDNTAGILQATKPHMQTSLIDTPV